MFDAFISLNILQQSQTIIDIAGDVSFTKHIW